jgi:hypothetical protein
MDAIREILRSAWFRWPFVIIAVVVFAVTVAGDGSVAQAIAYALFNAFFWSLAISGVHRLMTRYR